jgi:hypothetical protein
MIHINKKHLRRRRRKKKKKKINCETFLTIGKTLMLLLNIFPLKSRMVPLHAMEALEGEV